MHSWSGLGIREKLDDMEVKNVCDKGYMRKRIKNTSVLIIDEISMIKASQFEAVNKICQYVRRNIQAVWRNTGCLLGRFFSASAGGKKNPSAEVRGALIQIMEKCRNNFVTDSAIWKKWK